VQTHTHRLSFTTSEVRKTYVSWDRGEADREWACLKLLAAHAPGLAPRPLRRELDGEGPVVVMERLPGEPLGGQPMTAEQTESLGRTLRRMYSVPLTSIEAAGLQERLYGPSTLPDALVGWLGETGDLDDCQDPRLVADAVRSALVWLSTPGHLPGPRLTALGIADLNPANVLWDGTTCRLVDFEDGGLTDPGYELADHVEHLAGRLAGVFDVEGLVAAVGLSTDEHRRMLAYRRLWSVFWLAMLLPGNGGFRRNPPGTTEDQARRVVTLLG